ncbi:helix-turn-helix protein [Chitinophaga skermanii]|uniref:Helix-turn-helix protein n=1 Tax=Chitinophaga skermanii TaxID=331697 RepID=A0A327QUY3_9BACT|nr:helix-turn-helix domain-containing protein [Chitinophaga skermanii]RAJ05537.1 helix-turn-helix protein [Chitinophaga skermanii]
MGIVRFDTISQYSTFNNHETLHPLVNVIDLSKAAPRQFSRMSYGFYTIFLKQIVCGDLRYGKQYYDYQEGTLIFLAPGQLIGVENNGEYYQPQGHALVFHADLLLGTSLGTHIQEYSFFSYAVNEALHLSEKEQQIVFDCFNKIKYELEHAVDNHSKQLIVANIELFLKYCKRFYDRQFITRDAVNRGVLEKFEQLLNNYFQSELPQKIGLPTVAYMAAALHLSSNYFGDLIKKESGQSAQEYIQAKIIEAAKQRLYDPSKTVNEIAYELGFKYPQHFSRLFKQRVGATPLEFRNAEH